MIVNHMFCRGLRGLMLGTALSFLMTSTHAEPQTFPNGNTPIRLVLPFAAGGGSDVLARLLAPKIEEQIGASVIVENRTGAGGAIGASHVAKSKPDGHTALVTVTSLIQAPHLIVEIPYDPIKDFEPVQLIARVSTAFIVRGDLPVNSMAEFIELIKREPNRHSIGNYGIGTLSNIQGAVLVQQAGLDAVEVAYQGAPPLANAIMSGDVSGAFTDIQSSLPLVETGRLKILGVTGTEPVPVLPDAPVLDQQGYENLNLYGWIGVFVPKGTPEEITKRLADSLRKALDEPEIRERLLAMSFIPGDLTQEEFASMVKEDYHTWGELIRNANIKLH